MREDAHKLRNGWLPTDEVELNDVLCRAPGFELIAVAVAEEAALRDQMARDIIRALIEHGNNPANPSSVKACADAREFLADK